MFCKRNASSEFRRLLCPLAIAAVFLLDSAAYAVPILTTADFENLSLPSNSYVNNSPFTSQGASFNNTFTDFGGGFTIWDGWSYSNRTDTTTVGYGNQYSAIPGSGAGGSAKYGIGFVDTFSGIYPRVTLPTGTEPVSMQATNTTYDFYAIRDGDDGAGFVKGPFTTGDFFTLRVSGRDASNNVVGTVDFDLADYRTNATDPTPNDPLPGDYTLGSWATVDLSSLQGLGVRTLEFNLLTSDIGPFGANTPFFFAADNFVFETPSFDAIVTPEPGSLALVAIGLSVIVAVGWKSRSKK